MSLLFSVISLIAVIFVIVLAMQSATMWLAAVALAYITFAIGMNRRAFISAVTVAESPPPSPLTTPKSPEETIIGIINAKGSAQRHDFLAVLDMPRTSLGRVLDEMEKQGLIEQKGEGRGSYYMLKLLDK